VELNDLTLAELRQFGQEFGDDFFAAITLETTLDCHDVIGGTARERVRTKLAFLRRRLAAYPALNKQQEAVHAGK
jgi:argininosuccinate lyase